MKTISLALLLLSGLLVFEADLTDYDAEARAAWAWAMKPPEAPKKVIREVVTVRKTVSVVGIHSHRCPSCGTVWSHGASSHGSLKDHTCPSCNRVLPYPWYPMR